MKNCYLKKKEMNSKYNNREKKTKRNIRLDHLAKARAYELMMWLLYYIYHFTCFLSYYKFNSLFILLGFFIVCQIYFILRLWL